MKNFLLNPLRISIIVLHLQRQTKNKDIRKDDEQCIAYYSRGGPSSH